MKTIKELIESFQTEDGINFEEADKEYQKHINDIVAKKTDPEKLTTQAIEKLVSELGIEANSVDDIKTYIKKMGGNTDDIKELNLKLEKELELERNRREEVETKYNSTQEEIRINGQLGKIKALGVDDERAEFLHYKLNKQVDEEKDFDTVLAEYTKENANEFRRETTTFRKRGETNTTAGDDDVFAAWEKKYGKQK